MDIAAPAAEVIESIVPLGGLFLLVVVAGAVLELVGRLINRFKRKPARGRGAKILGWAIGAGGLELGAHVAKFILNTP